jgi:magnesium chelatase family protein
MNPCKCGYLDDPDLACNRVPKCAQDYQARLSGPLLDRIDLYVDVPAVHPMALTTGPQGESSKVVALRVAKARAVQQDRYKRSRDSGKITGKTNAVIDGEALENIASPDEKGRQMLMKAIDQMKLTARGYHRVLRVARTLADMEGKDAVLSFHIAEALAYRRLFRKS